jgi:hypothetical protein
MVLFLGLGHTQWLTAQELSGTVKAAPGVERFLFSADRRITDIALGLENPRARCLAVLSLTFSDGTSSTRAVAPLESFVVEVNDVSVINVRFQESTVTSGRTDCALRYTIGILPPRS